ncbi:hypothetical protein NC651_003817 [Populus alba x Populus x berolinensis]|nr:hypothetical protein NC651_003817 [Populus alba x Populus x berolinensis]
MPLLFRCGHTATSMIPSIDPCKQKLLIFKIWPIQWALALKMAEMRESSISPGLELNNGAASRHMRILRIRLSKMSKCGVGLLPIWLPEN